MRTRLGSKGGISYPLLLVLVFSLVFAGTAYAQDGSSGDYSFEPPQVVLKGTPFSVDVEAGGSAADNVRLRVAWESYEANFSDGTATVEEVVVQETGEVSMAVVAGGEEVAAQTIRSIPGWFSILPPLLAIALIFRQVVPALFLGIYIGAVMVYGISFGALWYGLLDTLNVYVIEAVALPDGSTGHASIIVFTLMIGGMVGIVSRNGGMRGS